ncbi:hypothetical protein BK133_04715 [Paenibacillus sp. FSL H8-0548]|uniref:FxLYD domain-containing protein n=1 Tax=Paenibacillus sp. FSL H8-0548 TaxID=1920422 RepID=UPI00096F16E9|nr:FxLYD domain-containing protein [Paenibacillus sp. FSL H8-0548]OMF37836.1 hypothetical protein BK133_04715 [Paenibacillus sp. FSL H8-0548]
MYCHHCGKKRTDDAIYCIQCGRMLSEGKSAEADASAQEIVSFAETAAAMENVLASEQPQTANSTQRQSAKGAVWAWIVPIMLAFVSAACVFSYYIYQTGINDRVLKLQEEARIEALAQNYAAAQELLHEAVHARPSFAAVQKDADIVEHAEELTRMVAAADKQLQEQKLSEAELMLEQARNELKGHTEPIYDKLKEQLGVLAMQLGVMQLSDELAGLNSVEELTAKLNSASHLEGDEAAAVKEQIMEKIVDICVKEAEVLMKDKSYSDALDVTGKALSVVNDNERLIKLEKQINQAKFDYEKAEQQRLEHAMQQAAAEDLKNQTAAVEVVHIESTLDEFGDLAIEAELRNAATRPIYSISVTFSVMDMDGNKIGSGTAVAEQDYLESGETIKINSTVYGIYVENTTIVVDHATWYLN